VIYFTSDTHFYHKNIISYCSRPWITVEDMNAGLIASWNNIVRDDDRVYHLGDFAFCGGAKARAIFDQLRGVKHLVAGNHDPKATRELPWASVRDYAEIKVELDVQDEEGNDKMVMHDVILHHYLILSWNGMARGSWMLHGHCHGSLRDNGSLRMDVGVDPNYHRPVSVKTILNRMALRTVVPVDHHK